MSLDFIWGIKRIKFRICKRWTTRVTLLDSKINFSGNKQIGEIFYSTLYVEIRVDEVD